MQFCIFICISVYLYAFLYIYMHFYIFICITTYLYALLHIYMHYYIFLRITAYLYALLHIYMHYCIFICISFMNAKYECLYNLYECKLCMHYCSVNNANRLKIHCSSSVQYCFSKCYYFYNVGCQSNQTLVVIGACK